MAWSKLTSEELDVLDGLDRAKRFIERKCEIPDGPTREQILEKALQSIASMWPDLGMCAELVPEWVTPNDGERMRAEILWCSINEARKALNLPVHPVPKHWKKDTQSILEKTP